MKIVLLMLVLNVSIVFAQPQAIEDCQLMKNKEMEMDIISSNINNANKVSGKRHTVYSRVSGGLYRPERNSRLLR